MMLGDCWIRDACRELPGLDLKRIGGGEKSNRRISRRGHLLAQPRAVWRLGDVLRPALAIALRREQGQALVQIIDRGRGARDEARKLLCQGVEPISQFGQDHVVKLCIPEHLLDLVELTLRAIELRLLALRICIRRLRGGLSGRGRALPGGRGRRTLWPSRGPQKRAGDRRRDHEPKLSPGRQAQGQPLRPSSHRRPSEGSGQQATRWNRHPILSPFRMTLSQISAFFGNGHS
jgi:hypothetical protein